MTINRSFDKVKVFRLMKITKAITGINMAIAAAYEVWSGKNGLVTQFAVRMAFKMP